MEGKEKQVGVGDSVSMSARMEGEEKQAGVGDSVSMSTRVEGEEKQAGVGDSVSLSTRVEGEEKQAGVGDSVSLSARMEGKEKQAGVGDSVNISARMEGQEKEVRQGESVNISGRSEGKEKQAEAGDSVSMSSRIEGKKRQGGWGKERPQQGEDFLGEWQTEVLLEMLHIPPLMIHVALILMLGWIASLYKLNLLFIFTVGFAYVCYIENRQRKKTETRIRSEERKSTDRKRLLSDSETARWLNSVVESMWPIFLEKFASEQFLMRLAPWFLEKYKPWTAKKVVLQNLYLGRSPPVFTYFRAGRHPTDGDHLVLEMTVNFSAAEDMQAAVAVQMRKRLGFGIWTSIHISNIQVEGNLKVGVRFRKGWPVIERLRVSFSDAPVIRMAAKPLFSHGVDVTDLPGIAIWLDKMIIDALEHSLVEPNMLVVDVEKLVGDLMAVYTKVKSLNNLNPGNNSRRGDWFHVGKEGAVGTLLVEILKGEKLKPCDPNGKSDPYVKIGVGLIEFTTTIKRKTLEPEWHEHFRIPIVNWTSHLNLRVRDKDRFLDDEMGDKQISIGDVRDGQRHEMWVQLENVKTGRLYVALTVEEAPTLDDNESIRLDSVQEEDARRGSSRFSPAGSLREVGSRPENYGELSGSDSDEIPLRDECETVDVGVGQPGCVSIVNPGRHVVREAYSTECLRQQIRSKSRRRSVERGKESGKGYVEREKEPGKVSLQQHELDCLQPNLESPKGGNVSKKNRVISLLRKNRSQQEQKGTEDLSGELSPEANELVIVGNKGSEVHMRLELDDEDIEQLEASGMQDELPIVPESCELQGESVECAEEPERRSRMMKIGKGVIKQTGKAAQNIGHVFHRSVSS